MERFENICSQRIKQAHLQFAQANTQTKACQRACKANAPREIVLKNLPPLKKIKNAGIFHFKVYTFSL